MDKIILIFYISTNGLSHAAAAQKFEVIRRMLIGEYNPSIIHYVIPIEGETRVECINPKLIPEDEFQRVKEVLDKHQQLVDELVGI